MRESSGPRPILWLALCAAMHVLPASGAQAAEKAVLQLKWFHQFQFAGYYAAKEKGFFAEEGLDVEIRERDPAKSPIDNVLHGAADFGISDSSLILHRMRGSQAVALAAIFQHSPLVLLTRDKDNSLGPLGVRSGVRRLRERGGTE